MSKGSPNLPAPAIQKTAFDYSTKQWVQIAKSLQRFDVASNAVEEARLRLVESARLYLCPSRGDKELNGKTLQWESHWTKVRKLAAALKAEFDWLERDASRPRDPNGVGRDLLPIYEKQLLALAQMDAQAAFFLTSIEDELPKAKSKHWYQFAVLEVWTGLGGELGISRHPVTGKIKGPLVKYFLAATQPVHGGSGESLPGIRKRHKVLKAALEEYWLEMLPLYGGEPIMSKDRWLKWVVDLLLRVRA